MFIRGLSLLGVAFTFAVPIGAVQAHAQSATSLGLFAGVNSTTVTGTGFSGVESRTGTSVGVQVERALRGNAFLRLGLLYSMRGFKVSLTDVSGTFKEDFVEIPVLLGYRFPTGDRMHPFLMGGAHLGVKATCSVEGSAYGYFGSRGCNDPLVGGDFASTDVALLGGAGLDVDVAGGRDAVEFRYALGMQNAKAGVNAKHRGFTVGLT